MFFSLCTTCPTGVLLLCGPLRTDLTIRYVREAIPQSVLRLLCLYHGKLPSILVLNKMDEIPKSRRVFDLIRKLTCNHLDDGQATVKITHADTEGCSVNKYLKRKERALEESPDGRAGNSVFLARNPRLQFFLAPKTRKSRHFLHCDKSA